MSWHSLMTSLFGWFDETTDARTGRHCMGPVVLWVLRKGKEKNNAVYHYHCMLLFSSRFGNTPAHTGSHHLHIQWYPLPSIAHHNQTASSWSNCIWLLTDRGGKDRHRYPSGLPNCWNKYMHCTYIVTSCYNYSAWETGQWCRMSPKRSRTNLFRSVIGNYCIIIILYSIVTSVSNRCFTEPIESLQVQCIAKIWFR